MAEGGAEGSWVCGARAFCPEGSMRWPAALARGACMAPAYTRSASFYCERGWAGSWLELKHMSAELGAPHVAADRTK